MIDITGLSMHYRLGDSRIDVLRSVDLSVATGQSVAITGPSGSGKTSLLLLLSGLERPAEGQIRVHGTELGGLDADGLADLRRDHIGIVFQSFHLLPSLSALDNVALPLQMAGQPDAHARATALMQRVGLGTRLHHDPSQLSGGEQQRVAIARAMAPGPEIIFADEPTGNLDGTTGDAIIELLFSRQRASGATLLIITHDPALATHCNRVIEMRDGLIIADRPGGAA